MKVSLSFCNDSLVTHIMQNYMWLCSVIVVPALDVVIKESINILSVSTVKFLKIRTPEKVTVIILKFG